MTQKDNKLKVMLETNVMQTAYYDETDGGLTSEVNGTATNLWRKLRQRAFLAISGKARGQVYEIHKSWMGDLKGKKVLELGVGHGCKLTSYLAAQSGEYHALDLSQHEIDLLKKRLPKTKPVHVHVVDFLSDDFMDEEFDLIYAHSVLHHFKHSDVALERVHQKLAPGGQVISYDPLQVWIPIRLLRLAYRPFQTDAAWEFPFSRATCNQIEDTFEVQDRFGVFNKAKWALLLGMLNPRWGQAFGDRWFRQDLSDRKRSATMMKSLHISFLMQKRDLPRA
jgi:2-polyprenyl-3-methyl-5-hydroxy-6-metoxy-1,4-benzoquinol methylase